MAGKIRKLVEEVGGEVLAEDSWGKRSLAYEIEDFAEGFYFVWELKLLPRGVSSLKKKLGLDENVLRFLLISH